MFSSVNDNKIFSVNNNPSLSAGKGFGNLDISNTIRNGNPSRSDNTNYKEKLESNVSFEYQINYLSNNSVNKNFFTKNTYVPINNNIPLYLNDTEFFNRVGENTRKYNQLNVDRMKQQTVIFDYEQSDNSNQPNNFNKESNNKITFDYN
jgi:hypothetical protein